MRGKHKQAAVTRRDREDLVREAEDGQLRAAKAERELAELKTQSAAAIERLRAENAQLAKDRDAAASPSVERHAELAQSARAERDAAVKKFDQTKVQFKHLSERMIQLLRDKAGMTRQEALNAIALNSDGIVRNSQPAAHAPIKAVVR